MAEQFGQGIVKRSKGLGLLIKQTCEHARANVLTSPWSISPHGSKWPTASIALRNVTDSALLTGLVSGRRPFTSGLQ